MTSSVAQVILVALIVSVTAYLMASLVRSIQDRRRPNMKIWKNFGLSLAFCVLFLVTWVGHGIAQWEVYKSDQKAENEPADLGGFVSDFSQATLENWQSEFLQLFSFTVMTALLIHKGSAESKDADEDMQKALKRIEEKLGTSPGS